MRIGVSGIFAIVFLCTCSGKSSEIKQLQKQEQEHTGLLQEQQQQHTGHERQQQVESTAPSQLVAASDRPLTVENKSALTIQEKEPEMAASSESENRPFNIHEHQIWDGILQKYVSETGQVDYAGIKNDRSSLDQYLRQLKENPVEDSWTRSQKLAYWINAYNAFTVDLIVRNYPLKSIMDLDKPWDQKFIHLGDRSYSLNEIEHEIVRPTFKDARVHFAFVCAAVSCPKLLNTAYLPQKLDQQLDAQTRFFLNTSGKNQLSTNLVKISKLFDWYGEDFTSQGTLIEFLNRYSDPKISARVKVAFLEYDWDLNE